MLQTIISWLNPVAYVVGWFWIVLTLLVVFILALLSIEDRVFKATEKTHTAHCHRAVGAKKVADPDLPNFFDDVKEFRNEIDLS